MKKYNVEVVRASYASKTFEVSAENEKEAKSKAINMAVETDYSGSEYDCHYNVNTPQEIRNDYIDRYGNPYDDNNPNACFPIGGGLYKDCEYNADALYAYYVVKDRHKIANYLTSKGFRNTKCGIGLEVWIKGNTEVTYECYDKERNAWVRMHTEKV